MFTVPKLSKAELENKMPTGYTAPIKDGISFRQYALNCARAFGALVLMRDDPADAPIPERFEPSTWNADRLQEASERLTQLRLMSLADTEREALAAHTEALRSYNERKAEREELRGKYEAMLAQVVAWQAPTADHVEYKKFMETQIRESIDFDCREYEDAPTLQSGAEWLAAAIKKAEWDVQYHTREDSKERERTEGRNAWVKALRDSLPA